MKKYLNVTVTRNDGTKFTNPLKLSEERFVTKLAQENKKVEVEIDIASPSIYTDRFGSKTFT